MRIVLISGIVFVHIPFDAASSPYEGPTAHLTGYGFF